MIAVVDYGVNNVKSVVRALLAGGHAAELTVEPEVVRRADRVLLPGVAVEQPGGEALLDKSSDRGRDRVGSRSRGRDLESAAHASSFCAACSRAPWTVPTSSCHEATNFSTPSCSRVAMTSS